MPKIVVIADDLTGANATGVLFAKNAIKVATFLNCDKYSEALDNNYEVVAINTDSRAVASAQAFTRVTNVMKCFADSEVELFSKRIDSTLRGNIGAEIDGALFSLGEDTLAIVVAAFPSSGRTVLNGKLFVGSKPLAETDAAKDLKTPVKGSDVGEIISAQSNFKVGYISLSIVQLGSEAIKVEILRLFAENFKVIVIDAIIEDDIDLIALSCIELKKRVLAVDPGPFTASLGRLMLKKQSVRKTARVLMAIGSIAPLTHLQLLKVQEVYCTAIIPVNAARLLEQETADDEIAKATSNLLDALNTFEVVGIHTLEENGKNIDLAALSVEIGVTTEVLTQRITTGLGRIVRNVLEQSGGNINGLYTTGGDVTLGVCEELNVQGIQVLEEVLPLAAYCRLIGGEWNNLPIITKGGLVGDADAMLKCVSFLFASFAD